MKLRAVLLVALLAGCTTAEKLRESEPTWSAEYQGEYRTFATCVALAAESQHPLRTIYDESNKVAYLAAYWAGYIGIDHEITIRQMEGDLLLVELRQRPAPLGRETINARVSKAADGCAVSP